MGLWALGIIGIMPLGFAMEFIGLILDYTIYPIIDFFSNIPF